MSEKIQIEIRPMEVDDCATVEQLEKECFSIPKTAKSLENSLKYSTYQFLTAWVQDQLVGYIGSMEVMDEADIVSVAVFPQMRKKGIGDTLVRETLKQAVEKGIKRVFLEVREGNKGAIHLYENCGFEQISIRKNYYEAPVENAIIMSVDLTTRKRNQNEL